MDNVFRHRVGEHDDVIYKDDHKGKTLGENRSHHPLEVSSQELEAIRRALPGVSNRVPGESQLMLVFDANKELSVTLTEIEAGGDLETTKFFKQVGDSRDGIVVIRENSIDGTSINADSDSGLVAQ